MTEDVLLEIEKRKDNPDAVISYLLGEVYKLQKQVIDLEKQINRIVVHSGQRTSIWRA